MTQRLELELSMLINYKSLTTQMTKQSARDLTVITDLWITIMEQVEAPSMAI
jgi:hypothetical protein